MSDKVYFGGAAQNAPNFAPVTSPARITGLGASWGDVLTGAKNRATQEVEKFAGKVGGLIAKPVADETASQTKSYLPWVLLGVVGVMFMGGIMGGWASRGKRR